MLDFLAQLRVSVILSSQIAQALVKAFTLQALA